MKTELLFAVYFQSRNIKKILKFYENWPTGQFAVIPVIFQSQTVKYHTNLRMELFALILVNFHGQNVKKE